MTATVFAQRAATDRSAQRSTADKSARSFLATGPGNQDAAAIFEVSKTNATSPSTILRCINGGCIRNRRAGVGAQVVIA
jgi:hypothetical protein